MRLCFNGFFFAVKRHVSVRVKKIRAKNKFAGRMKLKPNQNKTTISALESILPTDNEVSR